MLLTSGVPIFFPQSYEVFLQPGVAPILHHRQTKAAGPTTMTIIILASSVVETYYKPAAWLSFVS